MPKNALELKDIRDGDECALTEEGGFTAALSPEIVHGVVPNDDPRFCAEVATAGERASTAAAIGALAATDFDDDETDDPGSNNTAAAAGAAPEDETAPAVVEGGVDKRAPPHRCDSSARSQPTSAAKAMRWEKIC